MLFLSDASIFSEYEREYGYLYSYWSSPIGNVLHKDLDIQLTHNQTLKHHTKLPILRINVMQVELELY